MSRPARGGLLLASLILSGCGDGSPGNAYFPMTEGAAWTYRVERSNALGETRRQRLTLTSLGPTRWQGRRVHERRSSHGTHYYLERRADGLYRVARRRVVDRRPIADRPPRLVLPRPPRIGTRWQVPSTAYLLTRIEPFRARYRPHEPVRLDFTVVADDATVAVPAGRFEHCLHVRGEARIHVASDARLGLSEVPIRQQEWYCPGVGLVRLTRRERLYSARATIIGGTLDMQLTDFDTDPRALPWTTQLP